MTKVTKINCPNCTQINSYQLEPTRNGSSTRRCKKCGHKFQIKVEIRSEIKPINGLGEIGDEDEIVDGNSPRFSEHVYINENYWWQYFTRIDETPEDHAQITGKYLFFSPFREVLLGVVKDELELGGFFHAKINTEQGRVNKNSKDFVLCLYYFDDSRKYELATKYRGWHPNLYYRYWKSDAATQAGIYSDEFIAKQKPG